MTNHAKLTAALVVLILVLLIGVIIFSLSGNVTFAAIMSIIVGLIGAQTIRLVSTTRY
jgi:uncharacterized membrane protein